MALSAQIRQLLKQRNMTIKELAEQLGYSGNNLSNKLASDNFSARELQQIAEQLDCDLQITFIPRDRHST